MSRNEMFISTSNIIALWQLILLTSRHEEITVRSAVEIALSSGLVGGGLPADQGLKLGQYCRLLEITDSQLLSSQYCKDEIMVLCDTEEPNQVVVRAILLRYTSYQNLEWLLFFNEDPEIFKAFIPSDWIELLERATLFDFDNSDVREWWNKVFSRFQTYKEGQKLEIGKVGEKLTFEYEKRRLSEDGLSSTYVKWAALFDDKYGYDILSIRAKRLKFSSLEKDPIQIEVKCSVVSNEQEFRFYVSKNEWKVALMNLDSYFFYCWSSTNLEKETASGPFVIPAIVLSPHIPTNNGGLCEWSECKFVVDLATLSI